MSVYDRWWRTERTDDGGRKRVRSAEHGCIGRWQVRWRDDQGGQRKRNFDRKPDAEGFDAERAADSNRGDWIDPRLGRTTFGEYVPVWMDSRLHKPTTREDYLGRIAKHITPTFGRMQLGQIRQTTVQAWVKSLTAARLAPRTVEGVYIIFASIIRGAVRDGLIRRSPCIDIRLPAAAPTTVCLLSPGQVSALYAAMPQRYAPLALLGAGCGLRQGEALGLCLDRVRFLERMITVDQQVVIVNRRPVLASPKSPASVREVPLPRFLGEVLSRHVGERSGDDPLFATPRGNLIRRDYFNARVWKPAVKAAGGGGVLTEATCGRCGGPLGACGCPNAESDTPSERVSLSPGRSDQRRHRESDTCDTCDTPTGVPAVPSLSRPAPAVAVADTSTAPDAVEGVRGGCGHRAATRAGGRCGLGTADRGRGQGGTRPTRQGDPIAFA